MDSERRRVFRERAEHKAEWKAIPLAPFELLALLDAADERDRLRKFADGTLTICPGCYADLANGEPLSEKHLVCDRCGAIVEGFKPETWQAAAFAMRDERDRLRKTNARLHRRCQLAESQIKTTVDDCRRQGVSFGRILANAACEMVEAERDRLREAVDEVRRLVPCFDAKGTRTKRIADILDAAIEGRE